MTREQFYLDTMRAEYRAMGRVQRWLFGRVAPFIAISVRHLTEDSAEYLQTDPEKETDR